MHAHDDTEIVLQPTHEGNPIHPNEVGAVFFNSLWPLKMVVITLEILSSFQGETISSVNYKQHLEEIRLC